ncbi:MAG: hypothetical protein WC483_00610 [Candidatus Paceibacterota bacterium]
MRRVSQMAVAATIPISAASTLYYASQPRRTRTEKCLFALNVAVLAVTVAGSVISYMLPCEKPRLPPMQYAEERCPIMCMAQLVEERRRKEEEAAAEAAAEEAAADDDDDGEDDDDVSYFEGLNRRVPAHPRSLDYHRQSIVGPYSR